MSLNWHEITAFNKKIGEAHIIAIGYKRFIPKTTYKRYAIFYFNPSLVGG